MTRQIGVIILPQNHVTRGFQKYGNAPTMDKIHKTAITVKHVLLELARCRYLAPRSKVRSLSKLTIITVKKDIVYSTKPVK